MELIREELGELILLLEPVRIQDDGPTRASILFGGKVPGQPYKIALEAADGSVELINCSTVEEYRTICSRLLHRLKKGYEEGLSFAALVSRLIKFPVARA